MKREWRGIRDSIHRSFVIGENQDKRREYINEIVLDKNLDSND